ncbi:hypothetical protein [Deinococcus marmoris]|uniref:Uncharacterized protein n=1 Tax=Deinococcus marmoris TaxID=249408 RepID=A0A1U7P2R3_9DEIO|nr:hypothetical protein [Deinococcus marmoris]OLV19446.1 hypothetical protein BOO71_0002755 [Deinococcus marmoris]
MKNILLILLTGSMLAACTPKSETTTTTDTTTTTTDATVPDATTTTDSTTDTTTTDEPGIDNPIAEGEGAMDNAADPGVDSTLTNADDASVGEEVDMAVGDGLEGTVADFDGTAQTFTLNENDANYAVTISPDTVFEGTATTAEDFFGTDRAAANVAVEGEIDSASSTLKANKITLN